MKVSSLLRKANSAEILLRVLLAIFVVSLCVLAVVIAIRSKIFDFDKGPLSADETQAIWVFIGSGLAASVTLIGLLVAASQNRQAEKRLGLDTAVRGIALAQAPEGGCANEAVVAGSLSTLVHLDHPVIAMRMLAAAWDKETVDSASAIWLVGEVLEGGTDESKIEAARLFEKHADRLCEPGPGRYEFPAVLEREWPVNLPFEARLSLLLGVPKLLTSKPKPWWISGHRWVCPLLEAVLSHDDDQHIQALAADLLELLLSDVDDWSAGHRLGEKTRTYQQMKGTLDACSQLKREFTAPETRHLLGNVQTWLANEERPAVERRLSWRWGGLRLARRSASQGR